ncbi:MAG: hypothetical protein V2I33_17760 [Kangiellaceae bacterium]|nr:hypothetical protein [Kangiellaceae bacterium]
MYRYVNIKWTLIILLLMLHGGDMVRLSYGRPGMEIKEDGTDSPVNPILRFFVAGFLILGLGYFQIVSRRILSTWFPTRFSVFVDLCSISNISVFIFDELLHGYYIHGESPTGNSDGTMEELRMSLY